MIEQNNKLIAEFMGTPVKLFKEDDYTYTSFLGNKCYASFDCELAIIDNVPYAAKDLCYHTSWDWLMPVIEKIGLDIFEENINELGDFDHCYPRTFGMMNKEKEYMFRFNRYSLHSDKKLINAAYCAVVEYIQSLNQQPND